MKILLTRDAMYQLLQSNKKLLSKYIITRLIGLVATSLYHFVFYILSKNPKVFQNKFTSLNG